jgi:hypothetical protein
MSEHSAKVQEARDEMNWPQTLALVALTMLVTVFTLTTLAQ